MDKKPGMFRYFSFGLRTEWLELFFTLGVNVLYKSSLGPKQKDALRYYLRDAEFINGRKHQTELSEQTLSIYKNEGVKSNFLWSIVWCNLCCNAPLFEWWSECNTGTYSRENITSSLSNFHGKANRSIRIAYQSLVGTLERTPIGKDLKQGLVQKEGRNRVVIKEGNPELSPFAVLYSLYKLAEHSRNPRISIQAIEPVALSPQKIFSISIEKEDNLLRSLWLPNLFELQNDENQVYIQLAQEKRALDVIDAYIERL